LPRDYEDRSRLVNMCDVVDGQSALLQGTVVRVDNKKMGLSVTLQDRTSQTTLRFFKVYRGLTETMAVGNTLRVFGEISISKYGTQISHPEYEIITGHQPLTNTGLIPVYPTVKNLHQNKLRSLIRLALQTVKQANPVMATISDAEWQIVQSALSQQFPLLAGSHNPFGDFSLLEAISFIHQPPIYTDLNKQILVLEALKNRSHPTCQRLIIEEMLAHQLSLLYRKQQLYQHKAPRCDATSALANR
ncbi:ATP-dependent DNA helicase RecG, partial [Escherichia coli]|nr:ATP-dependent DNA helicase RecG [Escherichia coli]